MKGFLKKLKLIDYLSTELEIDKNDFFNRLKASVDEGDIGMFSETFDVFSSSKNEYKGHVGLGVFKIKRRRKFFDMNMHLAIAKGTFKQRDNHLKIDTEINGFSGMMIPFYVFLIVFYLIFIIGFSTTNNVEGNMDAVALPFIIIHATFMLGIPYFMMRRSVKRMKHELEREFYYMTKIQTPYNVYTK